MDDSKSLAYRPPHEVPFELLLQIERSHARRWVLIAIIALMAISLGLTALTIWSLGTNVAAPMLASLGGGIAGLLVAIILQRKVLAVSTREHRTLIRQHLVNDPLSVVPHPKDERRAAAVFLTEWAELERRLTEMSCDAEHADSPLPIGALLTRFAADHSAPEVEATVRNWLRMRNSVVHSARSSSASATDLVEAATDIAQFRERLSLSSGSASSTASGSMHD